MTEGLSTDAWPARLRAQIRRGMGVEGQHGVPEPLLEPAFVEAVDEGYGWFLYCFSRSGVVLGAVWHMTRDEAMQQAEREFKVAEKDWEVVNG